MPDRIPAEQLATSTWKVVARVAGSKPRPQTVAGVSGRHPGRSVKVTRGKAIHGVKPRRGPRATLERMDATHQQHRPANSEANIRMAAEAIAEVRRMPPALPVPPRPGFPAPPVSP